MTSEAMNVWQETRDKDAPMNAKVYNVLMNTGAEGQGRGGLLNFVENMSQDASSVDSNAAQGLSEQGA